MVSNPNLSAHSRKITNLCDSECDFPSLLLARPSYLLSHLLIVTRTVTRSGRSPRDLRRSKRAVSSVVLTLLRIGCLHRFL